MSEQADELRRASLETWDAAAEGWAKRAQWLREHTAAVSEWLVDALELQPGHRVLELAAGPGETGFLAAELIAPGGTLICSDQSEAMLAVARARAEELGLRNVEFRVLDGEWIDLPLAGLDAVVCRWGYMLMADPGAALQETRRVLRSDGRVSLAVWAALEDNPWAAVPAGVLVERGLDKPPVPGAPGPFALGDRQLLRALLEDAGFTEIEIDAVAIEQRASSFREWWEARLDTSPTARGALAELDAPARARIEREIETRLEPYRSGSELIVPGLTLVAAATA